MDPISILGSVVIGGVYLAYRYRARLPNVDSGLVAAVVAISSLVGYSNREKLGFVSPPITASVVQADAVSAVVSKISGDDAEDFGAYCLALAAIIEADAKGEYAKTVDDLRQINSLAGQGSLKSRLKLADGVTPKHPGFAEAFDQAVFGSIGNDDTFISPDQRAKLVKLLRDLHAALT